MNFLLSKEGVKKISLAVLSSIFFIISYPDYNNEFCAWIFLLPLFYAVEGMSSLGCFYISWFSAFLAFSGAIYWVVNSMYMYGGISVYLSVFFLFLLAAYLALFTGCFFMIYRIVLTKSTPLAALAFSPFLWISLEYLRAHLFTGFPWALAGYSQWKMLTLIQVADITGVYGISFLIVMFNSSLYYALFINSERRTEKTKKRGKAFLKRFSLLLLFSLIIILVLSYGNDREKNIGKMISEKETFTVGVVQGNIEQDLKWNDNEILSSVNRHIFLTKNILSKCSPEIIVWSETALPFSLERRKTYTDLINAFVKENNIVLLTGALGVTDNMNEELIYNSVFLINPQNGILGRYDKIHLVPFGEYIPLESLFRITAFDRIIGSIGSFDRGDETKVFQYDNKNLSVVICYEIIFPDLVRRFASSGAQVIFNVTNDAWFGRSSAPEQHFSNAVFRAIENRKFIVRSANTGISGVVAPDGRVLKTTEIFEPETFCSKISLMEEVTFYSSYGDIFVIICFLLTSVFLFYFFKIKGKTNVV